jgi:hypothetical protein
MEIDMGYYELDELAMLEMLTSWWITELAVCDFDGDTLRLLDEGD